MAQGEIRAQVGLALFQALIQFFGSRRTGMSGPKKLDTVVDFVAPFVPASVSIADGNTSNPLHKAEIAAIGQLLHDNLAVNDMIHKTSALESGAPLPALPPITAPFRPPAAGPVSAAPLVSTVETKS